MWFMPMDLDWDDEKDEGKAEAAEANDYCRHETSHLYVEKPLFVGSYWVCHTCHKEIEFNEIEEHHTVFSRCSVSPLPWD